MVLSNLANSINLHLRKEVCHTIDGKKFNNFIIKMTSLDFYDAAIKVYPESEYKIISGILHKNFKSLDDLNIKYDKDYIISLLNIQLKSDDDKSIGPVINSQVMLMNSLRIHLMYKNNTIFSSDKPYIISMLFVHDILKQLYMTDDSIPIDVDPKLGYDMIVFNIMNNKDMASDCFEFIYNNLIGYSLENIKDYYKICPWVESEFNDSDKLNLEED